VPRRLAHEAKAGEVAHLAFWLLILLRAGGVIAREVKVAEGGTCSGHHLLKLLLLLVPEAVFLLALALVAGVVPVDVVVLVGGVKLLPLRAVGDEVGGVTELEAAPRRPPPLLQNLYKAQNFLTSRTISSLGMLSYCSSESPHKEEKANFKADESVVLEGVATWPPT
jgi:hypothetical protein